MISHLADSINSWKSLNVLVIGEAILDCYLRGHSDRLCQEAPVPIVDLVERQDVPGGAANTAANVASLGARVRLLSVIGSDLEGDRLQHSLQGCGVLTDTLMRSAERGTLAKQRILANSHLLVRFDQGSSEALSPDLEGQLIEHLVTQFTCVQAAIVSDYSYGILTPKIIQTLATLQAQHPLVLVIDSKRLSAYRKVGAVAVKPNYEETIQLLGLGKQLENRAEQITPYGDHLLDLTGASMVAVTLDTEGTILFQREQTPLRIPAQSAPHHHAIGAGDTFVSALALALASGDPPTTSVTLAAAAAAVVVQEAGTTLCQAEALRRSLIVQKSDPQNPTSTAHEIIEGNMDWNRAKNILCVRLDAIGDVVMTTPAIGALKAADPSRRLTLMTSSAGARIAHLIPDIDDLIVYDAPWLKATQPRQNSTPESAMIEQLRQANFDAAVIFTVYSQNPLPSAFLCYMADIPLRLAHCHENPYQLLTHWVKDPEPERSIRHEVRRQLDLVMSVGGQVEDERLRLKVPEAAYERVEQLLEELGLNQNRPWLVIHPGATAESRRYPPESYAVVARKLFKEEGIQILFTGTTSEDELVEFIRETMGVASHSLVDRIDLSELAALLTLAPLLISNNTGPVHIAAAIGTPVVDLYALTNPQHTPWGVPHRVLFHDVPCRNCYKSICPEGHHHCLRLVQPETVVQAALELLDRESEVNPTFNSKHCISS